MVSEVSSFDFTGKMVRTYKPKTDRAAIPEDAIQRALQDLLNGNCSVRKAATDHGISKSLLHLRFKKLKEKDDQNFDLPPIPQIRGSSKYSSMQVFNKQEEDMLEDYLIQASKMQYGLTYKQIRDFAYSYASKVSNKIPKTWEDNKTAGVDWMKGFMRRHPKLSLRKPENTSLARNMNFNKQNVNSFFENLKIVTEKSKFPNERIINIDESGITTVLQAPKVVAPAGVKQVGQTVSAERGELVTICAIVDALGNTIPPAYIFPRVFFKDSFLVGAPPGSIGFASKSGWMTKEIFVEVVKHVQKHTSSSKENPILVLLDNHETHVSIDLIKFCRKHGIVLLTFPPHTSHRLQPLDVGVFSSFKNNCKAEFNSWISQNPGKTISIYHVAGLSAKAYDNAFTRANILSGFKKTGIVPFDPKVFNDDDDFAPSIVTDQPLPLTQSVEQELCDKNNEQLEGAVGPSASESESVAGPSKAISMPISVTDSPARLVNVNRRILTPEEVRPFPKSGPRKESGRGRNKGKTCILTDTPEKDRIEEETNKRNAMKASKLAKICKRKLGLKQEDCKKRRKSNPTKKMRATSDTETDESLNYDNEDLSPLILSEDSASEDDGEEVKLDGSNIDVNNYVLVKLCGKKSEKYYVAEISDKQGLTEFTVNFLRKKDLFSFKFVRPDVPDTSIVDIQDLVCKLPEPKMVGGTERAICIFTFKFNFNNYNMG